MFNRILKNSAELLGLTVGIITSITFILTKIGTLKIEESQLLLGVDFLNILVLLIALLFIKDTELGVSDSELKELKNHLTASSNLDIGSIVIRVNQLVRQLVRCIWWFAIILALFYGLQLFTDATQEPYEKVKATLNGNYSILQLLSHGAPLDIAAAKHLSLEILTNSTNLFSASFLFLAFQVLFLVTLGADNKTWTLLKNYIPIISIAILITVINVVFFVVGFSDVPLYILSHTMRLLGGIYNGVAMLLLFSRFISMEFFFKKSSQRWQKNFYFYGTVIILPLYVIAQPMYGIFNAVEMGQSAALFKSVVFLVCFWGKLVFLLFIFTTLSKKWLHSYLFISLTQMDTLTNVAKDLKEVDDL